MRVIRNKIRPINDRRSYFDCLDFNATRRSPASEHLLDFFSHTQSQVIVVRRSDHLEADRHIRLVVQHERTLGDRKRKNVE